MVDRPALVGRNWHETTDVSQKHIEIGSDVEIANLVYRKLTDLRGEIVHAEGDFLHFRHTHWSKILEHELRLQVHKYDGARYSTPAGKFAVVRLGKTRIDSILNELAVLCARPGFFDAPAPGINCASGFISFDADGTPRLEPHRPEHRCRHCLPGRWQPGASGTLPGDSLLAKLLTGCFKGDPDGEAKCALLSQIGGAAAVGYATRLKQPRAVVLLGRTAENGKSQVLDVLRGLLPETAICSVPASAMADDRHVIGLRNKLLNACDELSVAAITSDAFKAVVTGDPIQGRDVYKSRVEFRPLAQSVFATNQLPSFRGCVDRGVQRRLLLITFARTIPLEERVENIGKRIATEEPDLLLAWAVEGASRLIRQHNFTIPQSCQEDLREWVLSEDPVAAWVDARVKVVPIVNGGPTIASRAAYNDFLNWAMAEGYRPEKLPVINGFVQRVQALVPGLQHKRTSSGRVFIGLKVTQP